ncbi:MAG TPA: Gfo/Idh/MocA family oxidoreductase [Solirubrobacterales bacterium]|nr:Gfo/Idh/MocA family oxidoreductase [Solirubrobacterales bacterium]
MSTHDPGGRVPIRWGVLGTGSIARLFARDLEALAGAQLVAVASRSRERAEAFGREFGIPHRFGSYADLAGAPMVDVVYIATPASAHRDNTLLCLEAGKAVLCEKPFTVDAGQAREVVAAARRHGRFLMEAMWTRFLPATVKLRELLAAGAIGDVRCLIADLGSPTHTTPKARLLSPELGGGALLQRGIYLVSLASMILGGPDQVTSMAAAGPTGVDEQAGVLLGYQGGQHAMLLCSLRVRTSREATVVGTAGQIRIHAPVVCPSRLTLRQHREDPPAGGEPGRSHAARERLIHYGKRSRLLRRLRERYSSLGERLVYGIRTKVIPAPVVGEGLWYQAAEVMQCLRAGHGESAIMPLDESVAIMETVDRIRSQWGVR